MTELLQSWSWQDIQNMYKVYGQQLSEYKDIADRFEMQLPLDPDKLLDFKPGDVITLADVTRWQFTQQFTQGVVRVNRFLQILDQEIARRNKLIGVI